MAASKKKPVKKTTRKSKTKHDIEAPSEELLKQKKNLESLQVEVRELRSLIEPKHLNVSPVTISQTGHYAENGDECNELLLPRDTYSLMITSESICSPASLLSGAVTLLQYSLYIIIILDRVIGLKVYKMGNSLKWEVMAPSNTAPFNIPIGQNMFVALAQLFCLIINVLLLEDIKSCAKTIWNLWDENVWRNVLNEHNKRVKRGVWAKRIGLPMVIKFIQGSMANFVVFVVIVQSSDIVNLFKNFTALLFIAELDEIIFTLARVGHFGGKLKYAAFKVDWNDRFFVAPKNGWHFQRWIAGFIFVAEFILWCLIVNNQQTGKYLEMKYPGCNIGTGASQFIGNGFCENIGNTEVCGWEGGDCTVNGYPKCHVSSPLFIGDGNCDFGEFNNPECGWDGGDCEPSDAYPGCEAEYMELLGDGVCNGGSYNTISCGWDAGDCLIAELPGCHVDETWRIGNGLCDNFGNYVTSECNLDGGDCEQFIAQYPNCSVSETLKIGDGQCNGGLYNTEDCLYDGGDCVEFNTLYPNCKADDPMLYLGNTKCDGGIYNTAACGWDGYDCLKYNAIYPRCNAEEPFRVGDGKCDGGWYNTEECGWDGGDCLP